MVREHRQEEKADVEPVELVSQRWSKDKQDQCLQHGSCQLEKEAQAALEQTSRTPS